jgi:hypothetical protein
MKNNSNGGFSVAELSSSSSSGDYRFVSDDVCGASLNLLEARDYPSNAFNGQNQFLESLPLCVRKKS